MWDSVNYEFTDILLKYLDWKMLECVYQNTFLFFSSLSNLCRNVAFKEQATPFAKLASF